MRAGQVLAWDPPLPEPRSPCFLCTFLNVCLGSLRPAKEPVQLLIVCLESTLFVGTDVTPHDEQVYLH